MPGVPSVHFTLGHTFSHWDLSPFPLVVLALSVATALWYLRADWSLAARGRHWGGLRTAAFLSGLVFTDLAFCSSVAVYANDYFQAHVLQHLLLMVVAPPLLALGMPSTLFLQTASRRAKERWLRVLRSDGFAVLSHPVTVFALYFGAMFVFFLTPLIGFAMEHMAVMDFFNVVFLAGGTLYWWPMVGLDPIVHWKMTHGFRLMNILIGGGVEAFLGVAILNNSRTIAPMYSLAGTHSGGALLWVSTEFVSLGAFLPIYIQWMRSEDRIGAREDARSDRAAATDAATGGGGTATPIAAPRPSVNRPLSAWEAAFAAKGGHLPTLQAHRPPPAPPGADSAPGPAR
ncbi:MAG: integral rane protein [Acidimicrobiaceae bacterium]|nr:integral rane protein [Acidimicrobiaceae bacterium]